MKNFFIIFIIYLSVNGVVYADKNVKKELVLKHLELVEFSAEDFRDVVIHDLYDRYDHLRLNNPSISDFEMKVLRDVSKEVLYEELSNEKIYHLIYELYDETYTADELSELVKLSSNPRTVKVISKLVNKGGLIRQGRYFNSVLGVELHPKMTRRIMSRLKQEWELENKYNN